MFDAYELQPDVSATRKRFVAAFLAASFTLAGLGAAVALIASRPATTTREKQVDVSFRPPPPPPEPAKIETPPPPPPPKPKVATPKPVVVAEAVARPPVAAPAPAAAPMIGPKEVPKTVAPESSVAVAAIETAVGGTGDGTGKGVGTAAPVDEDDSPAPVVAKAGSSGPVNLPEDADPPEPSEDNAQPEYPEAARTTGQEARVVLKIVVERDGSVGRIQVLKGEEPFVTSALSVVKTWKYEPAQMDGEPLAVFKIVNITFSLRD
ncbi:MAG: energy transducer TonB [Archangium sp.]